MDVEELEDLIIPESKTLDTPFTHQGFETHKSDISLQSENKSGTKPPPTYIQTSLNSETSVAQHYQSMLVGSLSQSIFSNSLDTLQTEEFEWEAFADDFVPWNTDLSSDVQFSISAISLSYMCTSH